MPNKANIDEHVAKRAPGATTANVTAAKADVGGTLSEGALIELINAVNGSGGRVELVAGVLTIKY